MATTGWFRPPIGRTSLPNRSITRQSLNLRACFIEYPLASKIIVRNLSYTTSESCLKEEFSNFGQIAEGMHFLFQPDISSVWFTESDEIGSENENILRTKRLPNYLYELVKDETSRKSKGYAFVQYTNQDDAMSALEVMDRKYLDGRVVFVELARPIDKRSAYPKTSGPPQGSPYSDQEQAQ